MVAEDFLCICFGFFSYNCLYLDMAFFNTILGEFCGDCTVLLLAIFAIVAIVTSHSCCWRSWVGKGGMLVCLCFKSLLIMGCICQLMVCFAR